MVSETARSIPGGARNDEFVMPVQAPEREHGAEQRRERDGFFHHHRHFQQRHRDDSVMGDFLLTNRNPSKQLQSIDIVMIRISPTVKAETTTETACRYRKIASAKVSSRHFLLGRSDGCAVWVGMRPASR